MKFFLAVAITISILMTSTEAIASEPQLDPNKVYIILGFSERTLNTYVPFTCENTPISCPAETREGKIVNIIDGLVYFLTRGEYDSIKTFGGTVEVTP